MSFAHFYKEHPKSCSRDDFWGQVKRTVNGKPVSQSQIDMIVNAVSNRLELTENDLLLDLCCGNGALTRLLFARCAGGVGVDYSEHLIGVAREFFERQPSERYLLGDVVEFVRSEPSPYVFNKAVCYGSFQYLSFLGAREFLSALRQRFTNLSRLFIGNLPDKDLLAEFYRNREYRPGLEDDHTSMIGIWRSREDFTVLAAQCGWKIAFAKMPVTFYAAHYRYDAMLTPQRTGAS